MAGDVNFTLVQLRYFATAAEACSMTAAAQQLRVSQSAVSTAVSQLEHSLQVQLLIRHHAKGLSLTAAGSRFLQELKNFLAHADDLAETARGLGTRLSGELVIGCFLSLSPFLLPRLFAGLTEQHPDLRVQAIEGETEELQEALLNGQCELALMYEMDLAEPLTTEQITVAPPYVIVPPRHRFARRKGVRIAELAEDPFVLYDLPHSREYFMSLTASTGVSVQPRYRSSNYETVRSLVANGQGYSILNQRPVRDTTYDGGQVVTLPLLDPVSPLPVVLAYLRNTRLTRRAQAFAAFCRELLRSED
ncbi:LysR family transcriptional regulator [Sciscionella marina]|uniref:LysR family transcriptional regulator n=1 Tax=Sciscionella marina TaxID=508770 RepID=UPI00036C4BB6|nr:LysR family transcriptional regulator [Sciscionella marina]